MKKGYLIIFLAAVSALMLNGQELPKVAVLDATLGDGVDINASAIVADTINEQFVKSPRYRVTDRAYITSIQEEKQFQLSGDVSDEDIKALGETFGADLICAPHVSILGSTYTISARLIEVETAEVYSQESRRMKGDVDVLYLLAEFVGAALTGSEVTNGYEAVETVEEEPVQEAPVQAAAKPAPVRTTREKPEPMSHFVISWVFPTYATDMTNSSYDSILELDTYGYELSNFGMDFQYSKTFMKYGYFSMGLTFTMQTATYLSTEYNNFVNVEPYLGLGGIYAVNKFLDFYGGLNLGYMVHTRGDLWSDAEGEEAYGVTFGVEIGSDIYMGGLGLALRYRYAYASDMNTDFDFATTGAIDMGHGGFMVGIGFYF